MKCPKHNTEMEPNPEDSSEWYCSYCNYTYRYDKFGQRDEKDE